MQLNATDLFLNIKQSAVYNSYWKRIENKLTRVEKNEQKDYISDFFRTYLMCKQNVFISDANTYPEFKTLLQQEITLDHNIENIKLFYNDILKYLEPYLSIKFMDIQPELTIFKEQIFSLKFLQIEVITPFIVNIFVDFLEQKLTTDEVSSSLNLIETYLTRRIICGLDSSGLNKVFAELHKALRSKQSENLGKTYDDCLSAWLLEKNKRTVVLPTNAEITNAIKNLNFYSIKTYNQQFVLAKICDQSKESALLHQISDKTQKLSIEHIMPQKLTQIWKKDLGENWELVYNKWLNTLSNLTLTAYNSEYSNRSFSEKKTMNSGFTQSPFLLNRYVATFNVWNEDSLEKRTLWLAEQIEKIWRFPTTTLPLSIDNDNNNEEFTPYNWETQANMKPMLLLINDDIFEVNKWTDLYQKTLKIISENYPEKFTELINNIDKYDIAGRPLITTDETIPYRAVEISHGIFIEINLGPQSIMSNLKKICEYVGFTETNCPISFTVESR
ncbi:hypothetical protein FACS189429_4450 [Bacteroidia bacterium]|nr:hypothetical protein FACS189429_4450 [Bacteroidia bacterium]